MPTSGGLAGTSDMTSVPPAMAKITGGDLVRFDDPSNKGRNQIQEGLDRLQGVPGSDASVRWANPVAPGFAAREGTGGVLATDTSYAPQLRQWHDDQQRRWQEQKKQGYTAYVSPEEEAARASQSASTHASPPPQRNVPTQDVQIQGLHDTSTFEGRVAYAKAQGMSGADYLKKFGKINTRPQGKANQGDRS